MELRDALWTTAIILTATIAVATYSLQPLAKPLNGTVGIGLLTFDDVTNATSALRIGLKGYILAQLAEPAEPIVIPPKGASPVTGELWFVSYHWGERWSTNITLGPKVTMGNLTALSQPYGEMTLQVNEPTVISVTLLNSGEKEMILSVNDDLLIVDLKSDYLVLDSSTHVNTRKLTLSVSPSSVSEGDVVTIKVLNPGPWNVEFGVPFETEKMVDGSWKPVKRFVVWPMPMIFMGAGADWSQKLDTIGFESGLYRVSKEITYQGQKRMLYAEFDVTRPS